MTKPECRITSETENAGRPIWRLSHPDESCSHPGMTTKQRSQLYHDFSRLIAAGMGLDKSVEVLLEQNRAGSVKQYLHGIKRGLAEHLSISQSIGRHNAALVSPLEITLVEAGERGGRMDQAFEHLSHYFDLKQRAKDKAVGALIYPIILLHLGLMVPDLSAIMRGGSLQDQMQAALGRIVIAWIVLLAVGASWLFLTKAATTSVAVDNVLRRLPLIGSTRKHWAQARFCQVFQTGLLAAMNISQTLKLAGEATQSAVMNESSHVAARKVEEGSPLSLALKSSGGFPVTFVNALDTAEHSGGLDVEMGRWATAEAGMAAQAQDRAAEWMPRIFYFIIVVYVASRIVGSFSGIYGSGGLYDQMLGS